MHVGIIVSRHVANEAITPPKLDDFDWTTSIPGVCRVSTSGTGTWVISPGSTSGNPLVDKFENSTAAAINDEVVYKALLMAGTYRMGFYTDKDINRGIMSFYVNDVLVGTHDGYSNPRVNAFYATINSSITIPASIVTTIKIKVTGKHASSSGYIIPVYRLDMTRTA